MLVKPLTDSNFELFQQSPVVKWTAKDLDCPVTGVIVGVSPTIDDPGFSRVNILGLAYHMRILEVELYFGKVGHTTTFYRLLLTTLDRSTVVDLLEEIYIITNDICFNSLPFWQISHDVLNEI
jgi:hypothetical protein